MLKLSYKQVLVTILKYSLNENTVVATSEATATAFVEKIGKRSTDPKIFERRRPDIRAIVKNSFLIRYNDLKKNYALIKQDLANSRVGMINFLNKLMQTTINEHFDYATEWGINVALDKTEIRNILREVFSSQEKSKK